LVRFAGLFRLGAAAHRLPQITKGTLRELASCDATASRHRRARSGLLTWDTHRERSPTQAQRPQDVRDHGVTDIYGR
jgi:hypothetical protein